jgi:hypothetical protein
MHITVNLMAHGVAVLIGKSKKVGMTTMWTSYLLNAAVKTVCDFICTLRFN